MPGWTGFQLVHALKRNAKTRDIPVMMLTARDTRRDQAQMRAVGLAAYLVKPFSADKCIAMVERLLAERRLLDYKKASRLYLSEGTAAAAEAQAASGQVGAVRAEELTMTVLFADICGFTPLSHEKTPAEVVALLNEYFDLVCPIILDAGGDIDKFIGDAVMALFSDGPDRSGPLSAVRCALTIQQALKDRAESGKAVFTCRIGINTGPLVRGDYGSKHFRRDFTVIGDTVNLAQRYESKAPRGGVLISGETHKACARYLESKPVKGLRLKGVDKPLTAYHVTGTKQPDRKDRGTHKKDSGGDK
jgi:class 3 adenylate cyclase